MNKHIQIVEKWLNDKDSVTQAELDQNRDDASDAYALAADAYLTCPDASDAYALAADAYLTAAYTAAATTASAVADRVAVGAAAYWVEKYYLIRGEEK